MRGKQMKTYKIYATTVGPQAVALEVTRDQLETLLDSVRFLEGDNAVCSLNLEGGLSVGRGNDIPDDYEKLIFQIVKKWCDPDGHDFHKIDAIKELREMTHVGLREAKDMVEAVFDKLHPNFVRRVPEQNRW
jgi:hypothetical protein